MARNKRHSSPAYLRCIELGSPGRVLRSCSETTEKDTINVIKMISKRNREKGETIKDETKNAGSWPFIDKKEPPIAPTMTRASSALMAPGLSESTSTENDGPPKFVIPTRTTPEKDKRITSRNEVIHYLKSTNPIGVYAAIVREEEGVAKAGDFQIRGLRTMGEIDSFFSLNKDN